MPKQIHFVSSILNYIKTSVPLLTWSAVVAVVGLLAIANPTTAQQVSSPSESTEELTITAPRLVQRKVVGRSVIGAPIEVISLPRPVSYADLDLTKQSDQEELRKRIFNTAKAACKQLDAMYGDSNLYLEAPGNQNCVKTATDQAMGLAEQIIAAANAKK